MRPFFRFTLAALALTLLSAEAQAGRVYLPYRCTDDNGQPSSGCRAVTYEAGTSTPYQLFKEAALSNVHGDYVESDSTGFFPDAYGSDSQCIDIDFTASDGTTVIAEMDDHCPTLSSTEITGLFSGTAATEDIGTSGDALCKTNAACTWSGKQTFSADADLDNTGTSATAGPTITLHRDSSSPAADDEIGEVILQGEDDADAVETYGRLYGNITDPTNGSEDGAVCIEAVIGGTDTETLCLGVFDSSDTSVKGADLADGHTYYVNGFPAPGTPLAVLVDSKDQNTQGGGCTAGSENTRDLDEELFDPFSVSSISSNQFTLQPGTYLIEWSAPAYKVNSHQTYLYDITGTAEVQRGTTERIADQDGANDEQDVQTRSEGVARVTISSANTYEIRHHCEGAQSTNGLGRAGNAGEEIYTVVRITAG